MKRPEFIWWKAMLYGATLLLLAALLFPIIARAPQPGRGRSCSFNLKQIGVALAQYNQDFNKYPLLVGATESNVISSPQMIPQQNYGWADALWPYTKSTIIFQCPLQSKEKRQREDFAPTERGFSDYYFNSNLNGFSTPPIAMGFEIPFSAATVIAFGDGNDGGDLTDARYNLPALPVAWIKDQNSPAYRHSGFANYAFLDGHVKGLYPGLITNEPLAKGKPTFAVR